jgi:predicted Fe-Mo cluster-binding NifX family protein
MKIAVSSTGKTLEDNVSGVFGRCEYFIIAEIEDKKIIKTDVIENTSIKQLGGAGISAAQLVADKGANVVIAGNIGPRAMEVFNQVNIYVYTTTGIVKEVLEDFVKNELDKVMK